MNINSNQKIKNDKSKRIKIIILILVLMFVLGAIACGIYFKYIYNSIPNDYIAIFEGGAGEVTYSTYIYKIDNGQANYGFKYINTTNSTVSWGSPVWKIKITGTGEVNWTDDVFTAARNNGAYDYVVLPDSDEIYSIEEFMKMFIMN